MKYRRQQDVEGARPGDHDLLPAPLSVGGTTSFTVDWVVLLY